jgi:sigma-E factor negative regulatory protein RseA
MSLSKDYSLEETLSALMDGETDDLELRRLLKQIPDSPRQEELLDSWRRFHIARSVLHGELIGEAVTVTGSAATQQIIAAIAAEPAYGGGNTRPAPAPWYSIPGKLAVAASVTIAVFLGMQVLLSSDQNTPTGMAQSAGSNGIQNESGAGRVDLDAQRRLNEYIQTVSIQHQGGTNGPSLSVFEEIPHLRPVNQIELEVNPLPEQN